jgi:hypothetical protein
MSEWPKANLRKLRDVSSNAFVHIQEIYTEDGIMRPFKIIRWASLGGVACLILALMQPAQAQQNALDPTVTSKAPPVFEAGPESLASGAPILFFRDDAMGDDVFDDALANLGLAGDVTFTSSAADFSDRLDDQDWGCVIALQQNHPLTAAFAAQLAAYVGGGGQAIFTDWTVNFSGQAALYNAFEVAGTGNGNQTPITTDANPIWSGVPAVVNLFNPGWGIWSFGLAPVGGGVTTGSFPNGDGAVVVGNSGATAFNGFLSDTFSNKAEGVQIAENEINEICFPVIPVFVDIKPQSCPNPLNCKSKGVLPVAILGTADFDVTEIDPATVRLADVAPLRWDLEDVATPHEPLTGKQDCTIDCTEMGPDGYLDATLKFDTQEVIAALGEAVQDGACIVAELTGNLRESDGGTGIVGEDVIRINCKGK